MKHVVEVDRETFKGIVMAIAPTTGWKHTPVQPLNSEDARRRLTIGNVTFVENLPTRLNLSVEGV